MAKKINSEKYGFNKESVTLSQAVRLHDDIVEAEITTLWKWYFIGYAIMVGRFTTKEFISKAVRANKTTLSMAVSCAKYAEQNESFRNKLENDKFGSLRLAYDAIPNKKETSRKKADKRQSFSVNALVNAMVEQGLTRAQANKVIKAAKK